MEFYNFVERVDAHARWLRFTGFTPEKAMQVACDKFASKRNRRLLDRAPHIASPKGEVAVFYGLTFMFRPLPRK